MAHSRFLPDNYDSNRPVTIIAGKGFYPSITIESIRNRNLPVRLIAFENETRQDIIESFQEEDKRIIKVGQLGKLLNSLRKFDSGYAIMAGQITPKRLFRGLHPDAKALFVLAQLKERNAETIFGAIAREIEKVGVTLLDARSFLDHELATAGIMTGGKQREDQVYIDHGIRIAREVARLDIGQGVVVRKGTVVAVEAFEGTDDMLRRSNLYRTDRLIFVKTSKPGQDYRFDVPVFGLKTLEVMHEAGLFIACLESDGTIMLEKEKVLQKAQKWKMQILGY